jgi:hypothetical protein
MSDTQILEQRLRTFAAAPDDGTDWGDVLRRAGQRPAARRFSRRRLAVALAVVVVVAASAVGVFVTRGTRPAPTGPAGLQIWTDFGSNPWANYGPPAPPGGYGRQITIEELRAEAPFIPLPNSDLANDGGVGTVWVWDHTSDPQMPQGHLAANVYYPGSGIELAWGSNGLDYTGFRPSQTPTIDGVRAILLGPEETLGSGVSELSLPFGPNNVLTLEGFVPASDLVRVARTLSPSPGDASPAGNLPPVNSEPEPDQTRWEGVLVDPVSPASLQNAAGSLAFQPVAPSSLGDPSAILETDPAQAPASNRVVSLRYDDPSIGRFWLLERPSLTTTTSLLREIAADCTRATDCRETASMLDLGGGVSALSVRGWASERIVWVQNGVYYEVIGSVSTFSAADALAVAKKVAAG